jgi:hypothetical protein
MIVRVELDGQRSWVFKEPDWQELAFGVSEQGVSYWWSAFHLVVLPTDVSQGEPQVLSVDEPIRLAYSVGDGWLLVCEVSIRLFADGREVSRFAAGEVLMAARWEGAVLVVEDFNGNMIKARIREGRLVVGDTAG